MHKSLAPTERDGFITANLFVESALALLKRLLPGLSPDGRRPCGAENHYRPGNMPPEPPVFHPVTLGFLADARGPPSHSI
jgi:hypothetical protein